MSYIEQAGVIGYILLILFTIGITFIIWKSVHIFYANLSRKRYLTKVFDEIKHIKEPSLSMKVAKSIIDEKMSSLERGMATIKIIASISPLLGLLGTVVGILQAFEIIAKTSLGDPTAFAAGISLALVTTVMGLVIAIPHYIGYNYLLRNIDHLESIILKEIDLIILENKN